MDTIRLDSKREDLMQEEMQIQESLRTQLKQTK